MRFIFAHDGTAVNVAHIVTIESHIPWNSPGYVVRCRCVDGSSFALSPVLARKEDAQATIDAIVKGLLNPPRTRLLE